MKHFLKIAVVAAAVVFNAGAFAQFPSSENAKPGGPVAIGQVAAQVDPQGHVAIIQAPAPATSSGGVIQLSAFGWLEPYIDSALQALIVIFSGWFAHSWLGQKLDQSGRDALEVFLKNSASSLVADGAVAIKGKAVHVDNDMLYQAANQASTRIPDALKRFGLTPDVVAAKIVDAIPQTPAGAAIIATASTADQTAPVPVTSRPTNPNDLPPTSAAAS